MIAFISRFMPKTVVGRMTSVLFVGIFLAQILGAWLWVGQLQTSERDRMVEVSQAMGARIAQTVKFFGELPKEYRHIVLDQLRDCLLYTSPSPRDKRQSRMPSSA